MSLISFEFFALVLVTLIIYWIIPAKYRWIILLISSTVFVWCANGYSKRACVIFYGMIIVAYLSGRLLRGSTRGGRGQKGILIISISIEALMLIDMKESGFFVRLFNPGSTYHGIIYLVAPLGMSYYTLSLIGYICDVYWGVQEVETNVFRFILFGSYFPLLTSGPIVKYRETGKALFEERSFSFEDMCFGFQRIFWGLFKKLVISERIAIIVNAIYENPAAHPGAQIWFATGMFVMQLYTDFSGCIDIVLGISQLFGICLPENFSVPFSSRTLSEFWRRWHITLGEWLKEYVLYPVLKSYLFIRIGTSCRKVFGKKVGRKIPTYIGLFISWFLIGFWHGGSWNYIIGVGLYMWFIMIISDILKPLFNRINTSLHIRTECFSYRLFQYGRTFVLFMLGLGFFRAPSFRRGLQIYTYGIWSLNLSGLSMGSIMALGLTRSDLLILAGSMLILFVVGVVRLYVKVPVRTWISSQNIWFRWVVYLALIFATILYGVYGGQYDISTFIYQHF